jgi:thiamine-phosphate diphosphorylase
MFAVIGDHLEQLTVTLEIVEKLCQADIRSSRLARQIHETLSRVTVEEKILRARFEMIPSCRSNNRPYIQELPKVDVDNRHIEIHKHLRACQVTARSLEEYFTFFSLLHISRYFRKLRYDLYGYERTVVAIYGPISPESSQPLVPSCTEESSDGSPMAQALGKCALYFILDESIIANRDPLRVAFDAVSIGVRVMQLRFKEKSSRQLLETASKLKPLCTEHGCLLIINDRVDIAMLTGADGVHLGDNDLLPADAHRLEPNLIIGATARTPQRAIDAQAAGADYIGSGSVYSSKTKPGLPVIGTRGLARIVRAIDIPVVGIGGITTENCTKVLATGAKGFCSVRPFTSRRSIKNLAAEYCKLGRSTQQR